MILLSTLPMTVYFKSMFFSEWTWIFAWINKLTVLRVSDPLQIDSYDRLESLAPSSIAYHTENENFKRSKSIIFC